mmetsp:Transcript_29514/g.52840  ORF Transcript_29514/g.52840 Transcript_29514/m.52840 type:complete len:306 (+) Transcript_29514:719-1636(+)
MRVLVDLPEGIRDVLSHAVQRLVDQSGVARAKEEQIARLRLSGGDDAGHRLLTQPLLDGLGRVDAAALQHAQEGHTGGARLDGLSGNVALWFDSRVGDARTVGDSAGLDAAAVRHRTGKHPETAAGDGRGHVVEAEAVAGVGLVAAVALHRLGVSESRERCRQLDASHLLEHGGDELFVELHDGLLVHKRQFHVDLRKLGLPIRAQVFVAKAARDLVVAVKARHHEHLLEELRGLREGVPAACAQSGWHEVVPCALRGGARQDGRLDLNKAVLVLKKAANRSHNVVPQSKVTAHLCAPEIQHAVL